MLRVVFLGTPKIAVNSIMKLLNFADIHIVAVVTQPDRPAGRGKKLVEPPVKCCALSNGIPVIQTPSISKDKELIQQLKEMEPDFFITFAFGQILSKEVLEIPKIATINLHASLLPKYRGANPIQRAIYNGETQTGITTMITNEGLDTGDICLCEKIDLNPNINCKELSDIISEKSPFLLYRTLKGLSNNNIVPKKQNDDEATFAKKFKKEDGCIDWNESSVNIHNKVRAIVEWPCAYTTFDGKCVKILETRLIGKTTAPENCKSGDIISVSKEGIIVKTSDACLLISKVKPESKGVMSAFDWSNGLKLQSGDSFSREE